MSQTEDKKLPGINAPRMNSYANKQPPIFRSDKNCTVSIMNLSVAPVQLYDAICDAHSNLLNKAFVKDKQRLQMFAQEAACEHEISQRKYYRAEGTTIALTGKGPSFHSQVGEHRDKHNDPRPGYSDVLCLSREVTCRDPVTNERVKVRVAIIVYCKSCIGSKMNQLRNDSFLPLQFKKFVDEQRAIFPSDVVNRESSMRVLSKSEMVVPEKRSIEYHALGKYLYKAATPTMNKDFHYSLYVEIIGNFMWHRTRVDRARGLEALYCMAINPSSSHWAYGVREAILNPDTGNIVLDFVSVMSRDGFSPTGGKYRRRQVSANRNATVHEILMSLRNLEEAFHLADTTNDTDAIIARISNNCIQKGGVLFVGELTAHEIINVATKTGIIRNTHHARNVSVAKTTCTSDRLKRLCVDTPAKVESFQHQCMVMAGIILVAVFENCLCKFLKVYPKPPTKESPFFENYDMSSKRYVYFLDNDDRLGSFDARGIERIVDRPTWEFKSLYPNSVTQWWSDGFSFAQVKNNVVLIFPNSRSSPKTMMEVKQKLRSSYSCSPVGSVSTSPNENRTRGAKRKLGF